MLGYTKCEYWSLTITKCVQCLKEWFEHAMSDFLPATFLAPNIKKYTFLGEWYFKLIGWDWQYCRRFKIQYFMQVNLLTVSPLNIVHCDFEWNSAYFIYLSNHITCTLKWNASQDALYCRKRLNFWPKFFATNFFLTKGIHVPSL